MKKLLVTSGLPYSNGRLHVGHVAGAYLPADIYVRYQRLLGREVCFVCGSDDHGVAIMLTADKEGKTPREVSNYYHQSQKKSFEALGIEFDVYGSTCESKYHTQISQDFFKTVHKKGYFEKLSGKQFFDPEKGVFLPDRFVKGQCGFCGAPDQNGDQCEQCGKVLDIDSLKNAVSVFTGNSAEVRETVDWYFDLSQFEKPVGEWLEKSEMRDHTRNYVKGLLSTGLVKRSMTRNISWGIPVPLEDPDAQGKVLYVWFDAPIGYISNTLEFCQNNFADAQKYVDWWKSEESEIVHFIGEDNTIFHCIIWIAMLSAEGSYQLPKSVIVNQFLNIQFPGEEQQKISKSRGNAVWIEDYISNGGSVDALRYYLTSIAPEKSRAAYRPDDLIQKNNTDLANVLGNLVNRVISFTRKYCGPAIPGFDEKVVQDRDREFSRSIENTHEQLTRLLEQYSFKQAQETIFELAREANRYLDEKAPWQTRKTNMPETIVSLVYALQAIYFIGVSLQPFLPATAAKILKMLGFENTKPGWADALKTIPEGQELAEPEILFQKIESQE